jgi:long-subunit fatty acid transport protein
MRTLLRALLPGCAAILVAAPAAASNVTEIPDNGSEQMGRGGAWLARASDPLATMYNPAGLAGQPTRLTLQVNLPFQVACFHRMRDPNDLTADDTLLSPPDAQGRQYYPNVCNDAGTFPVPSLGLTIRATKRLGIGLLLTAPSGAAAQAWPEFVQTPTGQYYPAPERYLATYTNAFFVTPTVGVGWEPIDNLRIGASFIAGIANATFSNGSMGNNQNGADPRSNDIKATLTTATVFVPGFTVGALLSPSRMLDIAAWYKYSAPVDASADVKTYAGYYSVGSQVTPGNSALADCGSGRPAGICGPGLGHVNLDVPMEAKLGFRFHVPRAGLDYEHNAHRRDPMAQDVWDAELDVTWAHDSSIDALHIQFPADTDGITGTIPVAGTPGTVPANANVPHAYNDVMGVRLGGDFNVVPNKVAIRAGAFFESQAAATQNGQAYYLATDFASGARIGLALGATLRIPVKKDAAPTEGGAIELSAGYMHMFMFDLQNDGSAGGIRAIAGTACASGSPTGTVCPDGTPVFRSPFLVNLGTLSVNTDVVNVGASYRF